MNIVKDFLTFSADDLASMFLTLKLAIMTTLLLVVIATPIAWWLSHNPGKIKKIVSAFFSLPLVIPPTVLGFYLLIALGPHSTLAPLFHVFGIEKLTFSFVGILIGSVIFSFPFVLRPIQNSMESIGKKHEELAATMGASSLDRFFTIVIPLSKNGILNGAITGFAHTVGEFGVVLMIGGSIPTKTKVLSISIYEHVESIDYVSAHKLALVILIFSFLCLFVLEIFKGDYGKH